MEMDVPIIKFLLILSILYFFLEFFMKFNTGYYEVGNLITDR